MEKISLALHRRHWKNSDLLLDHWEILNQWKNWSTYRAVAKTHGQHVSSLFTGLRTSSRQCVHQMCRHFSRQPGFFALYGSFLCYFQCFTSKFSVCIGSRKYLYECTPFWYVTLCIGSSLHLIHYLIHLHFITNHTQVWLPKLKPSKPDCIHPIYRADSSHHHGMVPTIQWSRPAMLLTW